jgi:hypothetical protein
MSSGMAGSPCRLSLGQSPRTPGASPRGLGLVIHAFDDRSTVVGCPLLREFCRSPMLLRRPLPPAVGAFRDAQIQAVGLLTSREA